VHFAIEAVAEARRRGSDVTLTIAGEGPLQAWLAELARKAGVADSVEFLGHLDRASLLTAYADADVFVFPSLHDSSGNVVLEAMGAGLPVICLDLGGPKSFVSETTGFIVGASSMTVAQIPPAIANRLIELASDRPLLQRLSAAAVQRRTDFLWEKQVSRVYDDIAQYRSTGQSKVRT
jgi:glycosyltransferase involved in cell wall biosynthesis